MCFAPGPHVFGGLASCSPSPQEANPDSRLADALVAWKESGGFAGTFSPNAAFVQGVMPVTGGHYYIFKLKWKTNKPEGGVIIYAGAGSGTPFSPARLTAEVS